MTSQLTNDPHAHPAIKEYMRSLPAPESRMDDLPAAPTTQSLGASAGTGFHCYHGVAGNDCGQAAIAAILDFHGYNLGNMGAQYRPWPNDTAVAQVKADGFGPDVVLGFGTTGGRFVDAFHHYGFKTAWCGYVGAGGVACQGGESWEQCWQRASSWIKAGVPVPVLLDASFVIPGSMTGTGHWPIAIAIDGSGVHLANCRSDDTIVTLAEDTFLQAWNYLDGSMCGFSHCYVLAQYQ